MIGSFGSHVRRNLIAYAALFFALGGTSFAAVQALPRNSVGSPQIKNRSIQRIDISRRAAASLRGQRGPRGFTGAQGTQGTQGPKGDKGDTGPAGPLVDTLPGGKTLRGVWAAIENAGAAGEFAAGTIAFGFQMPGNLTAHLIPAAGPVPTGCSGTKQTPGAAPGHLCVFTNFSNSTFAGFYDSAVGSYGTTGFRYGALLIYNAAAAGLVDNEGSWAATAPGTASATAGATARSGGLRNR